MTSIKFLLILLISFSLCSKATPTSREKYSDYYLKLVELLVTENPDNEACELIVFCK